MLFRSGLRLTLNTLLLKAVAEGLKAAPLLEILPVSYTHLDVYKRQQ